MELILPILYIALGAWLIISPLVYVYWYFNRDARRQYEEHAHAVFLGTLITLTVVIGAVLTGLLVHLPESWGSPNQDGVFARMRGYMGFALGFLAAIHFMQSMARKKAVEDKKRALCRELEVNRYTNELGYLDLLKPSKDKDDWAETMAGSPLRLRKMRTNLVLLQIS